MQSNRPPDVVFEAPPEKLRRLVELRAELAALGYVSQLTPWSERARPEQMPPDDGDWRWWLAKAGRGWGKTESGAQWSISRGLRYPRARIALIAPTIGDARDTMVEGETGLLAVVDAWQLRGRSIDTAWNRSLGELYLANGTRYKTFSSEKPRSLRGPQHHFVWGDEPAYWLDAHKGTATDTTFSNANFGLRLRPRDDWDDDYHAQGVLTTTPRRVALMQVPDSVLLDHPERAGLLQRRDVIVITGRTSENVHNLSDDYYQNVIAPLIGTTLGRQELDAEIADDVEGALWKQAMIDADRITREMFDALPAGRRCVSFDPSGGGGEGHDEHGVIVLAARGQRPSVDVYVLADLSINGTPTEAARVTLLATVEHDAPTVVYEKNQGQDWIPTVLKQVWQQLLDESKVTGPPPRLADRNASKSKQLRAEPVVNMYEQHRVKHVGVFPELEDQQTSWVPDDADSPDRLDALVHGASWLYEHSGAASAASPVSALHPFPNGRMPAVATRLPR